jgi:hypothetical protein
VHTTGHKREPRFSVPRARPPSEARAP